jgi:hypothetical protein
MLGVLAVAYAWETYDLPGIVGGFVGGSQTGSGGYAVASAVGTQGWLPLEHFLDSITAPILWLGLLGAFLLLFTKNDGTPSLLSRHTLLLWAVILFVGSRTALSGFPVRFERDLGIPLALLAAFALGALVKSLVAFRAGGKTTLATATVAVALVAVLFGAQIFQSFERATEAPADYLMTPEISEAGAWLRSHNEGGNIIVGPHQNQVASRAMLAMGDYSALQSFTPSRISYDRDLPPHGPEPMWDVLRTINYPTEERTARILDEYDIRYVVFYKRFDPGTSWGSTAPVEWWRNYEASPELYDTAFENEGRHLRAARGSSGGVRSVREKHFLKPGVMRRTKASPRPRRRVCIPRTSGRRPRGFATRCRFADRGLREGRIVWLRRRFPGT